MWNVVEFLKDPYLVLKVQEFYGIRKIEPPVHDEVISEFSVKNFESKIYISDGSVSTTSDENITEFTRNGFLVSRSYKSTTHNSDHEDVVSSDSESESKNYVILNWFWYYLFVFGTELGDEIFYATFIPFWFWNIDGAVGRRVVMVWTIIMYIGQGIKDVVCWPRPPSPPVFRLQQKWLHEYGMPSTHAMVGISIPFSVILYTVNRYQYPVFLGLLVAVLWCTVMCISRIYLGMHSVLDVVAGLLLALILMVPVVPLVDGLDYLILTSRWSPLFLFIVSIFLIVFYPKGKGDLTPTRGDTTLIISVCVGVLVGAWTNYQLGEMSEPTAPPPYNVIWPSYRMMGLGVLRTVIGLCCVVGTRALCKSILYGAFCYISCGREGPIHIEINNKSSKKTNVTHDTNYTNSDESNLITDLCHKYFTYLVIGFTIMYPLPKVFRLLRIERPTFYTEI